MAGLAPRHERHLRIRLPAIIALPGRLTEVRLSFGVVRLVCEVPDVPRPQQTIIGVDLGVHTLLAATDGAKVFLLRVRGVKAVIQWRNKTLADIPSRRRPARPEARGAGSACNGASINCSAGPNTRYAMRPIRPRTRWLKLSPLPPATSVSALTTPPSAPDAGKRNR